MAAQGQHLHAKRPGPLGNRAANVAIPNYSQRLPAYLVHVEGFPDARGLIADHAAKVLGKEQHGSDHELAQG